MRLCIVGTGYVGLPLGAAFAQMGNEVICLDTDKEKVKQLEKGIIPIYEPGLEELVKRNVADERLKFTSDKKKAIEFGRVIFICVGTPSDVDGSADLQYFLSVASDIGTYMNEYKIVIDKSTVPVGSADKVSNKIKEKLEERNENITFDVVSNPEFMREGTAVEDMLRPDRVVIGTDDERAAVILSELYEPFTLNNKPIIVTDVKSAEMIKYASNCFLATKITFMNEMANVCEKVGANVDAVRKGMGTDSRISDKFLYAGLSYGGSCVKGEVNVSLNRAAFHKKHYMAISELYDVFHSKKNKKGISVKSLNSSLEKPHYKIITDVTKRYYEGEMIRFNFLDKTFECTPEHLMPVLFNGSIVIKQAKDITAEDQLAIYSNTIIEAECSDCGSKKK